MPGVIDYNRGVSIRQHDKTGMMVYMYKNTPGVYLNAHGVEVSDKLAKEAGFDTDAFSKKRELRAKMAASEEIIRKELGLEDDSKRKIVKERDGLRMVEVGLGMYWVESEAGDKFTPMPVSKQAAEALWKGLGPKDAEHSVQEQAKKTAAKK